MWSWYPWLLIRTSECLEHQGHPQDLLLPSQVLLLQSFPHHQLCSQSPSHVHPLPKFYGCHWYFHPESPVLFVLEFPGFLHSCSCCSYKPTCHMHKHWNNINQSFKSKLCLTKTLLEKRENTVENIYAGLNMPSGESLVLQRLGGLSRGMWKDRLLQEDIRDSFPEKD